MVDGVYGVDDLHEMALVLDRLLAGLFTNGVGE